MATTLRETASVDLRAQGFRGEFVFPGDAHYETARKIFNGMIDMCPAAIARCTTTEDVVAAVKFAVTKDLRIAVRGGGHSVAGLSTCDDGLVIDLAGLKRIE